MGRVSIAEKVGRGRKLLAPFLCAGFPDPVQTLPIMEALVEAGADLIEVGWPFSDPLADGPGLQRVAQRALKAGHRATDTWAALRSFTTAHPDVPVLLMSYLNPLLAVGKANLAHALTTAGVAGILVPDLPEGARDLLGEDLPPCVPFVTLTTPMERVEALNGSPAPFLYAVSMLGVTGHPLEAEARTLEFLRKVRGRSGLPVLVGFGISTPSQAQRMAEACDGVILGSALARVLEEARDPAGAARAFLRPFRRALDEGGVP